MPDSRERTAMKFSFPLGKDAAETLVMLNTAYKEDGTKKTQVYDWFTRFKKRKYLFKINIVAGVLQLLKPTKMSEKFGNWFMKIDVEPLRN